MSLSLLHWHIEPSSICTLKCPRCPRAEVPESLLNRQLTLEFFQNQIGENIIKEIRRITFCGNDGDPIYCKDFLKIVEWIKKINPTIHLVIITNGSHKEIDWWINLSSILNEYDELHFSIDGWNQDSNEKYRINSDFSSATNGALNFRLHNKRTYMIWAAIAFKFNEDNLQYMKEYAEEMNFDAFQLTHSTKFGSKYPIAYGENDDLEPSSKYVPEGYRFEREFFVFSDKVRKTEELKNVYKQKIFELKDKGITPRLCLIGNKGVFLNSRGEFYPCCWTATRYEHNEKWIEASQEKFNLHKRTFEEIINDEFWSNEFLEFDNLECRTKCSAESLISIDYMTEW